jgi:hypothetical protein
VKTQALLLILGSFCAPAAALAGSESFSTTWGPSAPPFSDTISLAKFDTALGALTSAEITLSSILSGEVDVYDALSTPETITDAFASFDVSVMGPGGTTTVTAFAATVPTAVVLPGFNSFPAITSSDSDTASVLDLIPYEAIGGGIFDTTVSAIDSNTFGGTAVTGVFFSGTVTAAGKVEITYNYVAVPDSEEPGFYAAFLCVAVFALVLIRTKQSWVPF